MCPCHLPLPPQVATKQDLLPTLLHALHSCSNVVCIDALELLELLMDHTRCGQVRPDVWLAGHFISCVAHTPLLFLKMSRLNMACVTCCTEFVFALCIQHSMYAGPFNASACLSLSPSLTVSPSLSLSLSFYLSVLKRRAATLALSSIVPL